MKVTLTTSTRILNGKFRLFAMTLVLVLTMMGACKKSTTDEQSKLGETTSLRFVFLADSRGDSLGYPTDTTALNPIIRSIAALKPKPSFLVFGGDMCYRGYMDDEYTFTMFKNLFKPCADSGITLYFALGNHELYHKHAGYGYFLVNQQHFQSTFSENPSNGPTGYKHLAYSFTHEGSGSFFAVLDPYFVVKDTEKENMGGHIDSVQMNWLKQQVAASNALHKFLFIHVPYYYVSTDSTELSEADTTITALWSFIDTKKFDLYACGHSHLYSRRTIVSSILPDPQTTPLTPAWQNNVVQLICGTCGAGGGGGYVDPTAKIEWDVHNDKDTYYFSVIDVSGNTTTVNSYKGYTGAYTVFETFSITR